MRCGLLLVCSCLFASPAIADTFRCNGQLVRTGMEAKDIRDNCGPAAKTRIVQKAVMVKLPNGRKVRRGTEITVLWYYDRGPEQYIARVSIRGSTAEQIDILDVKSIESLRDDQWPAYISFINNKLHINTHIRAARTSMAACASQANLPGKVSRTGRHSSTPWTRYGAIAASTP